MTPNLRKLNLTVHVSSSVGWMGAVVSFLALSIAALSSNNAEIVRSAYLAMNLIGQFVIVPLALIAFASGVIQAVGTDWGLFKYFWVLTKFILTIGATILLLLHQFTAVSGAALRVSMTAPGSFPDVGRFEPQLVIDAALAVAVLVLTTVLSVYKPWDRTAYGLRGQEALTENIRIRDSQPLGLKILLTLIGVIVVTFVIIHLSGHGFGTHIH